MWYNSTSVVQPQIENTHLKQLKFTAVSSGSNPVMDQRMRLMRRLEEQKQPGI
jgi:hypothetical protein